MITPGTNLSCHPQVTGVHSPQRFILGTEISMTLDIFTHVFSRDLV
jgi:hypothetical protein